MSNAQVIATVRMSQDRKIIESLAEAQRTLNTVRNHEPLSTLLATVGYDEAGLAEGESLCDALQEKLLARQAAMGAEREANAEVKAADEAARREYAGFRRIARVLFTDAASHEALGIDDRVTNDREQFIVQARNSYFAAQLAPYADVFAGRGFDAEALDAAVAGVHELQDADTVQAIVHSRALSATQQRNAAAETLRRWMREFKQVATVALEGEPHLYQELFS